MIIARTLTNDTLTLVISDKEGFRPVPIRSDHPKWVEIKEAFSHGDDACLEELISLNSVVQTYSVGELVVNATGILYKNIPQHTLDAERIMSCIRDKVPYQRIANYMERKLRNPSARAIQEMYNFLENRGMPLTERGTFIAYKGVDDNYWSLNGNKKTIVLQGQISEDGRILNTIGATIEVLRSCVDDDFRQGCSFGLHVGSIEYARGFGTRTILVEVDPADVVSVPSDCDCQKLRCCKYIVIGDCTGKLPDTSTTEFDSTTPNTDGNVEVEECDNCGEAIDDCTCDDTCDGCGNHPDECTCDEGERLDSAPDNTKLDEMVKKDPELGPLIQKAEAKNKNFVSVGGIVTLASQETLNKVKELIREFLDEKPNAIKDDSKLVEDFGLDSLDGVELTMALEEHFHIEISDDDSDKGVNATVLQIANYIEGRMVEGNVVLVPADENTAKGKEDDEDEHEGSYLLGMKDGTNDSNSSVNPKYQREDDQGADSKKHEKYIQGYIYGYFGGE